MQVDSYASRIKLHALRCLNMAIHAGMVGCALCLGEAGAEAAVAEAHLWQAGVQLAGALADLAVLSLFPKTL